MSFGELTAHLKRIREATGGELSYECKRLLTALSFDWCSVDQVRNLPASHPSCCRPFCPCFLRPLRGAVWRCVVLCGAVWCCVVLCGAVWCTIEQIDTSPWSAATPGEMRSTLNGRLQAHGHKMSDLWAAMLVGAYGDGGRSGKISSIKRDDLPSAMEAIGFEASLKDSGEMLIDVFEEAVQFKGGAVAMSRNADARLTLEAFGSWLSGREESMRRVDSIRFGDGRHASDTPLFEVNWTVESMRVELQRTLIHSGVSPLDLIWRFDKDDSKELEKREFLRLLKHVVGDEQLWYEHVRDPACDAFVAIAGKNKSIDCEVHTSPSNILGVCLMGVVDRCA